MGDQGTKPKDMDPQDKALPKATKSPAAGHSNTRPSKKYTLTVLRWKPYHNFRKGAKQDSQQRRHD